MKKNKKKREEGKEEKSTTRAHLFENYSIPGMILKTLSNICKIES